jgi:hypothetical protein
MFAVQRLPICVFIFSQLILHERGMQLAPDVYGSACEALLDDYEEVRLKAVKLLWVVSQIYPER